ncbi:MAG: hypothetical protein ACYC1M_03300 [Armatimonadota bacterium]
MAPDYAHVSHKTLWTHHPVWGDASWDTFVRDPHNPVHRGSEPMRWPVNGFLFRDPVSTNWYLYIGNYMYGYRTDMTSEPLFTSLYRSVDKGKSWTFLGRVLPKEHTFRCGTTMVHHADVSVVYADGKYHMGFDWAPRTTWERVFNPQGPEDYNGVAYAVSDSPEGPFVVGPDPVAATGLTKPVMGKYKRFYAATLIKRAHDWMMLCMSDGYGHNWVLLGMTAKRAEGPWSEPFLLTGTDIDLYYPPIMEGYPAFAHEGVLYAPFTSVAANRNFQIMCQAPLEEAHKPEAWKIGMEGSLFHGKTTEHERAGIWGQTFSGFVDPSDGQFVVMYPSLDSKENGSINIARRPWKQPYRNQGFFMSAHSAPSLSLLRNHWTHGVIDAEISRIGTCRLIWGYTAPLGPNQATSGSTIHERSLTAHHGVELGNEDWKLLSSKADEAPAVVATGKLNGAVNHIEVRISPQGHTELLLDSKRTWEGDLPLRTGMIGWLQQPLSECEIKHIKITPKPAGGVMNLFYTEALLGAGTGPDLPKTMENTAFRYGIGALYNPGLIKRAKWNFVGRGFRLFSPCLPEGGDVELLLDGKPIGRYQCGKDTKPSEVVFSRQGLTNGPHALSMRAINGLLLVDSLEVQL